MSSRPTSAVGSLIGVGFVMLTFIAILAVVGNMAFDWSGKRAVPAKQQKQQGLEERGRLLSESVTRLTDQRNQLKAELVALTAERNALAAERNALRTKPEVLTIRITLPQVLGAAEVSVDKGVEREAR